MAADTGMNLNVIGQVALDAAVEFYGGKLGLRLIGRFPPGLAFFDCAGGRLMVSGLSGGAPSGNSVLYFSVPDIRRGYEELLMAFFEDNGGNTIAIMEERGRLGG
jgi:catechol 2,3-dioxygenase-like lactoylglutathione lyase family enzyme